MVAGNRTERGVEPPAVEPVDVLEGGELHVVEPDPGAVFADQLGLVTGLGRELINP